MAKVRLTWILCIKQRCRLSGYVLVGKWIGVTVTSTCTKAGSVTTHGNRASHLHPSLHFLQSIVTLNPRDSTIMSFTDGISNLVSSLLSIVMGLVNSVLAIFQSILGLVQSILAGVLNVITAFVNLIWCK